MAIDPITGLEEMPQSGALAGNPVSFETPPVNLPEEGSGNTEIEIPDVGIGDAKAGVQERFTEEQERMQGETEAAIGNQPEYQAPDEGALDTIEDPSKYRTPEDKVSWQLNQLLSEDSPYMQQAQRRADEQAQRYGALGSSMHAGASFGAAVEQALPVAQQDAESAAKFGLQQQASENEIGRIEAETALGSALMTQRQAGEMQQQSLDNQFKLAAQGLDQESQLTLAELQGRWQWVTQDAGMRLESALKEKLNDQQIDAETVASIRAASSDLVQNYQIAVENLLQDPDFLQLGSETIQSTLNNMLSTTVASIQFMADSSGVNLDDYLDDFEINAKFTAEVEVEA